ncbi:MAG: hypothetical protein H6912_06950 [Kordiimonadaceae bacterium]|nr:hypothetical protein [Kordiimonadaceae bacterium]
MKRTYILILSIVWVLIFSLNQTFADMNRYVKARYGNNTLTLEKDDIINLMSTLEGEYQSDSTVDDIYYYYGFKTSEQGLFNGRKGSYYQATVFMEPPVNQYKNLLRWTGVRLSAHDEDIRYGQCINKESLTCELKRVNFVNLTTPKMNKENIKSIDGFIELDNEFEDDRLVRVLEIAKIPISEMVDNTQKIEMENNTEIKYSKEIEKNLHSIVSSGDYIPIQIGMATYFNNRHVIQIIYKSIKDVNLPIIFLAIKKSDTNNNVDEINISTAVY